MTTDQGRLQVGGTHPETAAVTNALWALGVRAPHTGAPYSEAMLLGIGGGLGAGYILWEFKEHNAKVLMLGFRNRWQYPVAYLQNLCDRIGVTATVHETGSRATAAAQLKAILADGVPAIAWVDRAHMPYLHMPEGLKGHIGHIVSICGTEDGHALVDDLAAQPLRVSWAVLADARARIGSYKHRLLVLAPRHSAIDLKPAVEAGLKDFVKHVSAPSESFSLPTFRKWARMMTDTKNSKGWPIVFKDGRRLYGTLLSLYEGVELVDNGGGALRGLYAAFLREAAEVVQRRELGAIATRYDALARMWHDLAEAAAPDGVAPLGEAKRLLREQYHLLMTQGDTAHLQLKALADQLGGLQARHNKTFPLNADGTLALFGVLGDKLLAIYEAETHAVAALGRALEG